MRARSSIKGSVKAKLRHYHKFISALPIADSSFACSFGSSHFPDVLYVHSPNMLSDESGSLQPIKNAMAIKDAGNNAHFEIDLSFIK